MWKMTTGLMAVLLVGCATVSENVEKQAAESVPETGQPAAKPRVAKAAPVKHAAIGAKVTASSTHIQWEGEGPAERLVDGDLNTRWSSGYADAQEVVVDLGKAQKLDILRLHWEAAAAAKYSVKVSDDGKTWRNVGTKAGAKKGPRKDEFELRGESVRAIKLDLQDRVSTNWGFSLFEIEAIPVE